eukprot:COSAG01_NODE_9275_length_2496_cov_1.895286_5_plen_44_part_00
MESPYRFVLILEVLEDGRYETLFLHLRRELRAHRGHCTRQHLA